MSFAATIPALVIAPQIIWTANVKDPSFEERSFVRCRVLDMCLPEQAKHDQSRRVVNRVS